MNAYLEEINQQLQDEENRGQQLQSYEDQPFPVQFAQSLGQPGSLEAGQGAPGMFQFLEFLNRPVYAMYGGAAAKAEGKPIMEGVMPGLLGKEKKESWDFLDAAVPGWDPVLNRLTAEEQSPDELESERAKYWKSWWLPIRNMVMSAGEPEPWWIAGKLAKIPRIGEKFVRPSDKVQRILAGSSLARHFYQPGDYPLGDIAQDAVMRLKRERREASQNYEEVVKALGGTPTDVIKRADINRVWNAIERGSEPLERLLPADIIARTQDMMSQSRALQEEIIGIQKRLGLPVSKLIDDPTYQYLRRERTALDKYKNASRFWGKGSIQQEKGRTIHRMMPVDEEGRKIGNLYTAKIDDQILNPRTGKKHRRFVATEIDPDTGEAIRWKDVQTGNYVEMKPASYKEASSLFNSTDQPFEADLWKTGYRGIQKQLGQVHTLRMMEELQNLDELRRVPRYGVPKGFRQLKIPGYEGFMASKPTANMIENIAEAYLDPEGFNTMLKGILRESQFGQINKRASQVFARNVLAMHPQYHIRNFVANTQLMWAGGVRNPKRYLEAAQVEAAQYLQQKGVSSGSEVIKGISNADLLGELQKRNIAGTGFFSTFSDRALDQPFRISDVLVEKTRDVPGLNQFMKGVRWPMIKGEKAVDWAFRQGQKIEDHGKIALAIDFIKKNRNKYDTMEETLDAAARHAQKFLFDYGELTQTEKNLKVLVPFYAWTRNMMGRTIKDIEGQPSRLARFSRVANKFPEMIGGRFLTPEEYESAPGYVQQGGATVSPWFERPDQKEGMFLPTFFSPYSTPEQLYGGISKGGIQERTRGLADWMIAQAAPQWKAIPELAMNFNTFTKQPIDRVADKGAGYQVEPLLGFRVPAMLKHGLKALPTGRYMQEAETLLGSVMPETFQNPYTAPMTGKEALVWYLMGAKATPFEPEKWQKFQEWKKTDYTRELKRRMQRAMEKGDEKGAEHYRSLLEEFYEQQGNK